MPGVKKQEFLTTNVVKHKPGCVLATDEITVIPRKTELPGDVITQCLCPEQERATDLPVIKSFSKLGKVTDD